MDSRTQARWLWALLALGCALRLVRYLLRFPLWEDECMLSANFLDRGYLALLGPLGYDQVCPPLFLWCQLAVVKLLGFTEYTLRLVPFLCGMASLFLLAHVGGRLLRGAALVLAVGVFAVGYPMLRYAAEAKPYGCDLALALAMLALAIEWLRWPDQQRWLWLLAAIVGPAVGFSYPAVFVGGGLSLVIAWVLWSGGHSTALETRSVSEGNVSEQSPSEPRLCFGFLRRGWLPWVVYNAILVASFAALMVLARTSVGQSNQGRMSEDWAASFPPWEQPWKLVPWFFSTHAGAMLGYPVGGPHGGSTLSLLLVVAGVAVLARRRQWLLLALLLAPLGMNFLAATLHRFPYGGHIRMTLYMGPAFSILIGLGAAAAIGWWGRRGRRPLLAALALLIALGGAALLRDLVHPYKSGTTLRAREFARWFWFDLAHDGELVCLHSDLKDREGDLSPGTFDWGWSALYLCNQRIYSPRHARGEPPQWDRVSADWPLRCAIYRSQEEERDARPLAAWLERMQSQYCLVAHDRYPFPVYEKWDRVPLSIDTIEVFKFVPKGK